MRTVTVDIDYIIFRSGLGIRYQIPLADHCEPNELGAMILNWVTLGQLPK